MEPPKGQGKPAAPTAEMIQEALTAARPELVQLFQEHWLTEQEAEALLTEAMQGLVLRWRRIAEPSLWLVRAVERAIQRSLLIPLFESSRFE